VLDGFARSRAAIAGRGEGGAELATSHREKWARKTGSAGAQTKRQILGEDLLDPTVKTAEGVLGRAN
jgi:hypothetical protein